LLAGEFAYKIKRPVQFPFLDFSSVERRRHFCAEELRINGRFAPGIYLRLAHVTLGDAGARIDGEGAVIDHAVVMRAFHQQDVLARLVESRAVAAPELAAFGSSLAHIHASLPLPEHGNPAGTAVTVAAAMGRNVAECLVATRIFGNQAEFALLAERQRTVLAHHGELLDARRLSGRVRETHGDLHLGNVVRIAGTLQAFDSMEFEPAFRWADLTQDVAFLYADLLAAGEPGLAQAFLNGYLQQSGDFGMAPILDLYVADRSLVRAKVMALLAAETPAAVAMYEARQKACLRVAAAALESRRPVCVMMHGPSGSGKSWLAAHMAGPLHALVVRSDLERRRLASAAIRRGESAANYGPDSVRATYVRLRHCAREALCGGQNVLLDATYSQRDERVRVRELCRQMGVPLLVVDCQVPRSLLEQRVTQRQRHGQDASEADLSVLRRQLAASEPLLPEEGLECFVADTSAEDVITRAVSAVRARRLVVPRLADQASSAMPQDATRLSA
jgi:aminoglycoside phosphotransferase family enzyme/predicted kinase